MSAPARPFEPLDAVRIRILRETESALLYGLLYPESPRIPRVESGRTAFSPAFARAFWSQALGVEDEPDAAA